MDPITILSTAATAIQLLQVAKDVSNGLRHYVDAIRGAESTCSELIDHITLISKAAQAAKSVLENSPPPPFRTPELQALHTEWFRSDGSPARCKRDLERLLGWLLSQPGGNEFTRGVKRLIWPAKEKKIRAEIQALEGHLPYFRDMLSIDTASWVRGIHSQMKNEHEHARNNETAEARRELLKWLDGLNCTVKHETTHALRRRTTGEWLLNEELYMDWRNSSIRFLWLGGKPGAGKSVLASAIIDNLSGGLADNGTLAYFYCDFRNPRSTSTMEVLRSLTVQFLRKLQSDWLSSKPFSELVTRKEEGAGPPVDIGTLSDLLRHAAGLHQRPMIVVDALDECDDLSKLLDGLLKLDADGHCRVLVTARPLHSIIRSFAGRPSISLGDRVDAVRKDMRLHIDTELASRDKLKTLSHDLQEEIRVALMEKADGMFRLVQLQLDRLNGCWSLGDLRDALDTLPATLYETYGRMLDAIDKKEFGGRVARRLSLINGETRRILRRKIPCHRVACFVTRGSLAFATSTNCLPEHNALLLGNLVTLQEHVSNHPSSYAFLLLDGGWALWMTMTSQLALYIIIRFGHVSLLRHYLDHCPVQVTKGENPLVHAALYADVPRFQMLLDTGLDVNVGATVLPRDFFQRGQIMLPLTAAIFNQDQELLRLLVKRAQTPRDAICSVLQVEWMGDVPRTQIVPAPSAIDLLLKHGADATLSVAGGDTSLHLLFSRWSGSWNSGGLEIARLLVEAGGNPAALNDEGLSPFHLAIRDGVLQFVQWLIAKGFRPPVDAILHAAESGRENRSAMLHVLVEYGIAVDIEDDVGNTALHRFYFNHTGTDDIYKLLLVKGCDINHRNHQGETLLHLATNDHNLSRIDFLIAQGAQLPDDIINYVCSADSYNPSSGLVALLDHLVTKHGASCHARTARGDNALHLLLGQFYTLSEPMQECLFLVENGCDFHAIGSKGISALEIAIYNQYTSITRNLISRVTQQHAHRQSDLEDVQGNTILHRLCYWFRRLGDDDLVVKLLHEAGFDLARHLSSLKPAMVSDLLRLGAKFSDVTPFFLDNVAWASDLPWYHDATEAYERALAKPIITFNDVVQVHHLLANDCSSKLPVSIVTLIMDLAEYWAHIKDVRHNVQCTGLDDVHEPIALGVVSNEMQFWMPRRVTFSCKWTYLMNYLELDPIP
ncbi:hypothetical protein BU15DRAFT_65568 [Melanogaster broomeanus]|nr:hypothetical protein BU15DRAFT_65568 [Melanogaster broomeanus]